MDVKNVDLKSVLDSCRTCMTKNVCMTGLFDKSCNNLIEEITFCTGVTLTQAANLPEKICIQCLKSLSIAHKFKTSCLLAEKTFHELLDNNVKCEPIEIIDVEYDSDVEFKKEWDHNYFDHKIKIEIELPVENKLELPVENKLELPVENKLEFPVKNELKLPVENNLVLPVENKPNQRVTTKARRIKPITTTYLHCDTCDIKFDNKEDYTQHKKEFHKNNERWVCEICGKVFAHQSTYCGHIRSHKPPKHSCHQCDYRTSYKHDLTKHIRTHTGDKIYQCEYCTASFSASSNLTGHIRRYHIIKERPFSCNRCDMSFFNRSELIRHNESRHNEIKRFTCDVCHTCFKRRSYWKRHLFKQHDIITPRQRPGTRKKNYIEPVTEVNTDSENNKSNRYTKRKELQKGNIISKNLIQKGNVISKDLIQKGNVISKDLIQKGNVISKDLIQKGNVISKDLIQKGNVISEDLIQKGNVISEDLIQKGNVISEDLIQKGNVISEDLIQKWNVLSEDLTQKTDK